MVTEIPITAKIRTGWKKGEDEAHLLAPKLANAGASAVTLHGRSRVCRYTGLARWDYINYCAKSIKHSVENSGSSKINIKLDVKTECKGDGVVKHDPESDPEYSIDNLPPLIENGIKSELESDLQGTTESTQIKTAFIGNGDVFHFHEFYNYLEEYEVDTCMIGRGALIKPWIFEEIKERRIIDKSSSERLDMLKVKYIFTR